MKKSKTGHTQIILLFPLSTVLLPGEELSIHVFEEKSIAMANHCKSSKKGFGVVFVKDGSETSGQKVPCDVGTMAEIIKIEQLPDQSLYLMASGIKRFRIINLDYSQQYLSAKITWLPDEDHRLVRNEIKSKVSRLFLDYVQYLKALNPDLKIKPEISDPLKISYQIVHALPITAEQKQVLLELNSVEERLQREIEVLRRFIPSKKMPDYLS